MIASRQQDISGPSFRERRELTRVFSNEDAQPGELIYCDPDELAEIRQVTESDLRFISKNSGTKHALSKESLEFLDATSVMRALYHVAEARFERGEFEAAVRSATTAIQWNEKANRLHKSGNVSLPLPDPAKIWLLIAESFRQLGEQDLAEDATRKVVSNLSGTSETPVLRLVPDNAVPNYGTSYSYGRTQRRYPASLKWWLIAIVIAFSVFAAVKIQATAKSMIDHSSLGTEYLGIGFRGDQLQGNEDEIVLATREFAALRAKLGSWSWAINTSSVLPPVRNQFRAMEKMADLGPRMVASRQFDQSGSRLGSSGSPANICRSAEELRSVSGNLIDQLEENRQDMLKHVTLTSRGLC